MIKLRELLKSESANTFCYVTMGKDLLFKGSTSWLLNHCNINNYEVLDTCYHRISDCLYIRVCEVI